MTALSGVSYRPGLRYTLFMGNRSLRFCKKCHSNIPLDNFPKDSKGVDGYAVSCKSCKGAGRTHKVRLRTHAGFFNRIPPEKIAKHRKELQEKGQVTFQMEPLAINIPFAGSQPGINVEKQEIPEKHQESYIPVNIISTDSCAILGQKLCAYAHFSVSWSQYNRIIVSCHGRVKHSHKGTDLETVLKEALQYAEKNP